MKKKTITSTKTGPQQHMFQTLRSFTTEETFLSQSYTQVLLTRSSGALRQTMSTL